MLSDLPMDDLLPQLLEAWRTNHRINRFLVERIDEEGMRCTLSKRGGRNVVRQLAHLHNVRVWHLENRARDLSKGLHTFATHDEPDKETLLAALDASAEAVAAFLERCVTGQGKARPMKKGVIPTLAYFIAHESHHRGNILLTLKQCGHRLPQEDGYAIWDWEKM
jgi:uncharacterized damage-inducible protein DinB